MLTFIDDHFPIDDHRVDANRVLVRVGERRLVYGSMAIERHQIYPSDFLENPTIDQVDVFGCH
jgi:hypothetical protein